MMVTYATVEVMSKGINIPYPPVISAVRKIPVRGACITAAIIPAIPANATLDFDVELISWQRGQKSRSEMSTDELVKGATKDKEAGVAAFKSGEFEAALAKFEAARDWLVHVYQEEEKATPLRLAIVPNREAITWRPWLSF